MVKYNAAYFSIVLPKTRMIKRKIERAKAKEIRLGIRDRMLYKVLVDKKNDVMKRVWNRLLKFSKEYTRYTKPVLLEGMQSYCYEPDLSVRRGGLYYRKDRNKYTIRVNELDINGLKLFEIDVNRFWFIISLMKGKVGDKYTASHRCHNNKCLRKEHIAFELLCVNCDRNMCVAKYCKHKLKCLRDGLSVAKAANRPVIGPDV